MALQSNKLTAAEASKFAGKQGFTATVCMNKVGRAFLPAISAQSNDPLVHPYHNALSLWLVNSLVWWKDI